MEIEDGSNGVTESRFGNDGFGSIARCSRSGFIDGPDAEFILNTFLEPVNGGTGGIRAALFAGHPVVAELLLQQQMADQ